MHNVCAGARWTYDDTQRFEAVLRWLSGQLNWRVLQPDALILFMDTDLAIASPDAFRSSALARRFHATRASHHVVFATEPTCWSPFGGSRKLYQKHGCSRDVLRRWGTISATSSRPWQCGRFLNSGAYMGFASDVRKMLEKLFELRRANAQLPAKQRLCYFEPLQRVDANAAMRKLSDQCLSTHVLLDQTAWIGLDYTEALFAQASKAVPSGSDGSLKIVPCGNASCAFSTQWAWRAMSSDRRAHPAAAATEWRRAEPLPAACGVPADSGPAFIHFNGPTKTALVSSFVKRLASDQA